MRIILLLLALCLAAGCKSPPADKVIQPGMIDLINADAFQVLDIYTKLSGKKLVKDASVKMMGCCSTHIALTTTKPVTKPQAIKLLEKALREQAGVVITPLDDTSVSVTYNAAMIVVKPKPAPQR